VGVDRVVALQGPTAGAVAAQVVGDDAVLGGQRLDLAGPEAQRARPAVHEHDGRRVVGAEDLGVQRGPVVRRDRQLATLQRRGEHRVSGVGAHAAPVGGELQRPGGRRPSARRERQRQPPHAAAASGAPFGARSS
jgi:hypothetical protein